MYEHPAPRQERRHPIPDRGFDLLGLFQVGQYVARVAHLAFHQLQEAGKVQMRAELLHHGEAIPDFGSGKGRFDFHGAGNLLSIAVRIAKFGTIEIDRDDAS